MSDYNKHIKRLDSPAYNAFAISPSDSSNLSQQTRGIYVGGDGNLKVTTAGGDTVTFQNAVAGTVLPVRAIKVFNSGSSATGLIGLY